MEWHKWQNKWLELFDKISRAVLFNSRNALSHFLHDHLTQTAKYKNESTIPQHQVLDNNAKKR